MSLSIDSKTVLRALTDNPETFPAVQPDIDDFARKMLVKQLKAKSTDSELFKRAYRLAGEKNMASVFDAYTANDFVALLKKIDPHNALVRGGGDVTQLRARIVDLATGRVAPAAKSEKAPKVKAPAKAPSKATQPKIGGILESKVHSGKASASRTKKAL